MKQIERYILRRMCLLSFWSLTSVTLLVMTTQVLIRVDVLTTTGQALGAFMMLAATLIPSVLAIVTPFAVLIGVSQVLSGMNADSELVVVEAAGVTPATVLKPVMVLSVVGSIMVLLLSHFVEPWSNRKLYDVLAQAQSDLFSVAVRSGTFMQLEDGLYVQVNEKLPGGELGGIFLADSRTEGNETIYYARSGVIRTSGDKRILYLVDGELQQRNLTNNQISVVTFTSYALDMAAFVPAGQAAVRRPKERETSYLLAPDADDYYVKNAPFIIKQELTERFSTWLYPLSFGLVSFVFLGKARSNRNEQFQNIAIVAAITISARGFGFYSADEAGSSKLLEYLTYGIPLTMIVVFGYLALTGKALTIPRGWARVNARLFDLVAAQFQRRRGDNDAAPDGPPA
ncbi:LptF/LptG family permease [Hoeflea olei]|uniref:Lipopolysaccharide export system permease protein LptF n=1 Tax=Hoeflea olei TaxID=1480615 RepID=A0A1C1YQH7_9HYPH|nr:LptF/LptG family permease [Hoeflea olei]OCW55821.1 hypothetical protein AWJ14_15190 [Hoeflea olei]